MAKGPINEAMGNLIQEIELKAKKKAMGHLSDLTETYILEISDSIKGMEKERLF